MSLGFPSFGQLEASLESFLNRVVVNKELDLKAFAETAEMKRALAALLSVKDESVALVKRPALEKEEEDEGVSDSVDSSPSSSDQQQVPASADVVLVAVDQEHDRERLELNSDDVEEVKEAALPLAPDELCDCHGVPFDACVKKGSCCICGDSFPNGPKRLAHSHFCHQQLCNDCLKDSLTYLVRSAQVSKINCPCCGFHLMPRELLRRLDPVDGARYQQFLLEKHLSVSDNVHRCGNPGCENAVVYDQPCALDNWKCEVCDASCAFCRQPMESHVSGACAAKKRFLAAERRQKVWSALNLRAKKCPQCRTLIIKNGGCRHMTCRNPRCGHQFCWHCKKDWSNHGVCPVDVLVMGGLIVASPVIAVVGVAAVAVVTLPMAAAGPLIPSLMFKGRGLLQVIRKYGRKFYDKYF